jgi:PST family polysaccharide transporter
MISSTADNRQASAAALEVPPQPESEKSSYGQILRSSALVGGSSVINIAIGIVRTKVMAVLLGPAGMGLFGLYNLIADLTQSVAGMGVNSSGVRQIAEAAGSNDMERIARTAAILRRVSILLGVLGAVLLIMFSGPIATMTFGSAQNGAAVSLLSIAVFCRLVSAGQGALIQGMRRISDLAKMSILGALSGTLTSIPLVYLLREDGIVPSVILVGATTIATSWWYSRKIQIQAPSITASQIKEEASSLLKLGFPFMSSGLMTIGSAYLVRIIVVHKLGLEATGFYQSAWTLGGLYVGLILQAMGADFYPRLTASASDNTKCNRLVNEQTRIGLLLAGPGVIATLTCAPLVIAMFYSTKFVAAVEILRWICLGTALQVITWPMGFIIVAKAEQALFFWCEVAWAVAGVSLAFICVDRFGLNGAGIAFFGSYIFHWLLIYPVVHRLSGFRWSAENKKTVLFFLSLFAVAFGGFHFFPFILAQCVGITALILSVVYSLRVLLRLTSVEQLPHAIRRFTTSFNLASSNSPSGE